MNLRRLLNDPALPSLELGGLAEDSRQLAPGDAFLAIKGAASDGHDHAPEAVAAGAVCALAERPLPGLNAPVIEVPDLAARRGALAARFYRHPSRSLACFGVTGTNGKTSIAHHLADLAGGLGRRAGYLGTLGWGELERLAPTRLTTADAVATQRRLASLRDQGCEWACLEVSSHALAQRRVDEVQFRCALFSNLSRDHLDYHRNLAEYGAAKERLFRFPTLRTAIVNVDDPFGRELAARIEGPQVFTLGRQGADLSWEGLTFDEAGLRARLATPWGAADLQLPLFGEFALANAAAAIGALAAAGLPLAALAEQARHLTPVPGRMEFFRAAGQPTVAVDYAHTPDALRKVLAALAPHCRGRLICLIGCGGNRDTGKRPAMGRAAEDGADLVWLTSDNPRWEDPQSILDQMRAGMAEPAGAREEIDRAAAIAAAIAEAGADDLVLVAGKGHEQHQEVRGRRHPLSDRQLVRRALNPSRPASAQGAGPAPGHCAGVGRPLPFAAQRPALPGSAAPGRGMFALRGNP